MPSAVSVAAVSAAFRRGGRTVRGRSAEGYTQIKACVCAGSQTGAYLTCLGKASQCPARGDFHPIPL